MAASRHSFMARRAASTAQRQRETHRRSPEQPLEERPETRAWQRERQALPFLALPDAAPRALPQRREQNLTWRRARPHSQAVQPISRRLPARCWAEAAVLPQEMPQY